MIRHGKKIIATLEIETKTRETTQTLHKIYTFQSNRWLSVRIHFIN